MIYLDYSSSSAVLDPDWDKVVLLLHGDGSNGGTIIDSSGSNHTATVTGTPAISTASPKWGTGALYFDATTGYISEGTSADWQFGSGDFTIEWWQGYFNWSGIALETPIVCLWSTNSGEGLSWIVTVNINGKLQFGRYISGIAVFVESTNGTAGVGMTTGYVHCAVVRNGTSLKMYMNGAEEYSGTISGTIDAANNCNLTIGGTNYTGNQYLNGYIDDLRISKGKARYTAAFTPPTAPFPDG